MFGNHISQIEKLAEKKKAEKLVEFIGDKHLETRLAAIDGLGKCEGEAAFNALIPLVHAAEAPVREHAVKALAAMGDAKARVHIEHQAAVEADPKVKQAIQEALAALHDLKS